MVETTENFHRIPVGRKKKDAKIRTINVGKGIKALYDAKNKAIVTYLFDVSKYTMKQAKDWVKKHKSSGSYSVMVENLSLVQEMKEISESKKGQVIDKVIELMEGNKKT